MKSGKSPILAMESMDAMHWNTMDPFLFCAHHEDRYPASASEDGMGVEPRLLKGRKIGADFDNKQGFSMYHGESGIPGFPNHPHFGFETVSLATKGFVDHSDSLGQQARYGEGDVQWLTAGNGIQHAEMFPLVHSDKPNTCELFQIWLNLPAASKTAPPHFTIAWNEDQPRFTSEDGGSVLQLVGGQFMGLTSVPPPPNSYASQPDNQVVIARITMKPHSTITLPAIAMETSPGVNRALYFYRGKNLTIANKLVEEHNTMCKLRGDRDVELLTKDTLCELVFLQGKPIGEPVVRHGPFVATSKKQLETVFARYEKTKFGGWKWGRSDPVHGKTQGRFYQLRGQRKVEPPSAKRERTSSDDGGE